MITDVEIFARATSNRLMIADFLETLDDAQWQTETLCAGWNVGHMAAHLLQPMLVGVGQFVRTVLRYRGDIDRTVDHFTRELARKPRHELIALLREHAPDQVSPPRIGPLGPFTDTCVHLRDIARPLGLPIDVPVEHWRIVLDYLTSTGVVRTLVPPGRLDGLEMVATDTDWRGGSGALLTGPIEAIGMVACGRAAALADLSGPGLAVLAGRLGGAAAHER
jgi:uncharacterized protein (TIGR03083 family)